MRTKPCEECAPLFYDPPGSPEERVDDSLAYALAVASEMYEGVDPVQYLRDRLNAIAVEGCYR